MNDTRYKQASKDNDMENSQSTWMKRYKCSDHQQREEDKSPNTTEQTDDTTRMMPNCDPD